MKRIIFLLAVGCVCGAICSHCFPESPSHLPVYLDPAKPLEERIDDAVERMTTAEKIAMIHAQSKFSSPGVPRLGIPDVWMTDGPHGIRPEVLWDEWEQAGWTNDSCVNFPALTCLAATWNRDMARLYGRSIGEEARYRRKSVLLGPGVNIYQTPLNGRNFEYMGEDPCLAAEMVVPYVQGVQENGVAACVKHFALNNHELHRHTTNVAVSDRALYELYLPAFRAAVERGGAWAIMGSYNLYQNQHCCHNKRLLVDILKGEWGFDGVVISDWGGTHNTEEAIHNGLDMEFGSWTNGLTNGTSNAYDNYFLAAPYAQMIAEGKVGTAELDDKVRRIMRLIYRTEMNPARPYGSMCSPEHFAAARQIAEQGMVLLKNEGALLPLAADARRVVVVGENAVKMMSVGGGSSSLKTQHEISPLEGLRRRLADAEVVWVRGYVGDPSGDYNGVRSGQDLSDSRSAEALISEAVEAAKEADYVIFVGGLNKSAHQDCEDSDRAGLELPYDQDRVIEALTEANPRLVVVNISGNAVAMPWIERVPAVVQAWYSGSEAGSALAAVLTGDVNPSGRLPFTFPVRLADVHAVATGQYPGTQRADSWIFDETYADDLWVGYRWNDVAQIAPLFPFGHGLSYTTFDYTAAKLNRNTLNNKGKLTLTVEVANSGDRAGDEVVQLYIHEVAAHVARPEKELKAFEKIHLEAGETKQVTFTIEPQMLAYFDAEAHAWRVDAGDFEALVAASATDIRHTLRFAYK